MGRGQTSILVAVVLALAIGGSVTAATSRSSAHAAHRLARPALRPHPQVVEPVAGDVTGVPAAVAPGRAPATDPPPTQPATAGALPASIRQSDAEIRRELRELKALTARDGLSTGPVAKVLPDGQAIAPASAPRVVQQVIQAGNEIAKFPYLWGGGHGAWSARGYDCSGSVSFALAGAGLLHTPLTSGQLAGWGTAGPGRWITIFANGTHTFMYVAGLRFDTGGLGNNGTRWQSTGRSTAGFAVRHPPGL